MFASKGLRNKPRISILWVANGRKFAHKCTLGTGRAESGFGIFDDILGAGIHAISIIAT
jgi:hypothetical protein